MMMIIAYSQTPIALGGGVLGGGVFGGGVFNLQGGSMLQGCTLGTMLGEATIIDCGK